MLHKHVGITFITIFLFNSWITAHGIQIFEKSHTNRQFDYQLQKEEDFMVQTEKATFGGGCFWCLEAVFEHIDGIDNVTSGYAGGITLSPTYEDVCAGITGHAEVVQIEYDPRKISYSTLLSLFFKAHDPTTLNRQGADVGTQYRSVIFYHSDTQRDAADQYISQLNENGIYKKSIVTEVKPFTQFYRAEEYHQNYFEKNPDQAYCRIVIAPKVKKFINYKTDN